MTLADQGAKGDLDPDPRAQGATASGIKSRLRKATRLAEAQWWMAQRKSTAYTRWELGYSPDREPEELRLPRKTLGFFLALRTGHGDFQGYHQRFNHLDAKTRCPWCDNATSPKHLVHCPHSLKYWPKWPNRPVHRPSAEERTKYMYKVLRNPKHFEKFLELTGFYSLQPRE